MCVDEAAKFTVGLVWAEGQKVGNIDGSRVLRLLQERLDVSLRTDAHTANRSGWCLAQQGSARKVERHTNCSRSPTRRGIVASVGYGKTPLEL